MAANGGWRDEYRNSERFGDLVDRAVQELKKVGMHRAEYSWTRAFNHGMRYLSRRFGFNRETGECVQCDYIRKFSELTDEEIRDIPGIGKQTLPVMLMARDLAIDNVRSRGSEEYEKLSEFWEGEIPRIKQELVSGLLLIRNLADDIPDSALMDGIEDGKLISITHGVIEACEIVTADFSKLNYARWLMNTQKLGFCTEKKEEKE